MSTNEPKPNESKPATATNRPPKAVNDEVDVYILRSIYPDAAAVFLNGPKPLEAIKNDCLVAVDTNALLLPYTTSAANLTEIKKTYTRLVEEDRLFIPAQVSREFAKNRAAKISDLYNNLSQKHGTENKFILGAYSLLSELPEYQQVVAISKEIEEKRKQYQIALKSVVDQVRDWTWSDPVTVAYAEVFSSGNVIEAEISEEDFKADCEKRQTFNIPPGFKDSSNGDLMIWHTILELGKKHKKDLIFVSGDEKTDWRVQSNNEALYPRFELVDEYRRASGGRAFHIVRLSSLLQMFGAEPQVVTEVQQTETNSQVPRKVYAYFPRKLYEDSLALLKIDDPLFVDHWARLHGALSSVLQNFPEYFRLLPMDEAIRVIHQELFLIDPKIGQMCRANRNFQLGAQFLVREKLVEVSKSDAGS